MATRSENYVKQFEGFLKEIGVTGAYFCETQYERWRGLVQKAFEDAESTTSNRVGKSLGGFDSHKSD